MYPQPLDYPFNEAHMDSSKYDKCAHEPKKKEEKKKKMNSYELRMLEFTCIKVEE